MTKERAKLVVDQDGMLQETKEKQIDVNDIKELLSVDFEPKNSWIALQPLPEKEVKTNTGIILGSKKEFKCAVIQASATSEYKRGQVVMIDPSMFGHQVPEVDYIDGVPTLMVPEHFIKGIYTKYDLSNWK
jgi:hypothetical protein